MPPIADVATLECLGDQIDQRETAGTTYAAQLAGLAPEQDQGLVVGQLIGDALFQCLIDQVEAVLRIVPEFHTKLICKLIGIEGKRHQGHSRRVGNGRYHYTPFDLENASSELLFPE
jgi:hypothetical protein